jgi:vitamin B12 transporter
MLIYGHQAFSQTPDSAYVQLHQTIVAANRVEDSLTNVPRSIVVLNGTDMLNKGYKNVAEALQFTPGCYIVGTDQTPGANQSVFMRGTSSEHVVVYLDGVRITDPSGVSNAVNLTEISLQNVDRIEVMRGAAGVAWGQGAVGGVINIVTHSPQKNGFSGTADVSGGMYGGAYEVRPQFNGAWRWKNGLIVQAGAMYQTGNGLNATVDTISFDTVYRSQDRDGYQNIEWNVKLGFQSPNNKLKASALWRCNNQLADIDAGAYRDDDNYTVGFMRRLLSVNADYRFSDRFSLLLRGGWSQLSRESINDSSVIQALGTMDHSFYRANYYGETWNADIIASFTAKYLRITGGLSVYRESMTDSTYYYSYSPWWGVYEAHTNLDSLNIAINAVSGWLNARFDLEAIGSRFKNVGMEAGFRGAMIEEYGFRPVMHASLFYKPTGGVIYANVQQGYNVPSLYRLYSPEKNYISAISRGNAELSPELGTTLEAGFRKSVQALEISGSIFWNNIANAIQYVYLWDGNVGLDTLGKDWMRDDYRGDTYLNMGELQNYGMELSAALRMGQRFFVQGQVSMTAGRLTLDRSALSDYSAYHIQHFESGTFVGDETREIIGLDRRSNTASVVLSYTVIKGLTATASSRFVSPRYDLFYDGSLGPYGALNRALVKDYALVDLGLSYTNKRLAAGLRVSNLLNTEYMEINGYRTRPLGCYLNVGYRF